MTDTKVEQDLFMTKQNMIIDLIEKGIHKYTFLSRVYRDDIRIYVHPIVRNHLIRELHGALMNYELHSNNDISVMGVRIVEGYDIKNIVIAAPDTYYREPLIIKLK